MTKRIILGAVLGAVAGIVLHFLYSPVLGGTCRILCRPERAIIGGAVLGAVVNLVAGRRHTPTREPGGS